MTPAPPGVRVEVVVSAAAQLLVTNPTTTPLDVLAAGGEPFLRIGATGVEANLASPDWYRSATPEANGRVPDDAVAGAPPRWSRVSDGSTWGWFDHRLHERPAAAPVGGGVVARWQVPMRYGPEAIVVSGHREYVRPAGTFRAALTGDPGRFGLGAGVVDGTVPLVALRTPPGRTVTVFGEAGEPMLRVAGASGPEANAASPTWRLTAAAAGNPADGPVGPGEAPRWVPLGGGSSLSWLEPRARYGEAAPPPSVQRSGRRHVLVRWEIPIEVDGRRAALEGTTSWVPTAAAGVPAEGPVAAAPSTPVPVPTIAVAAVTLGAGAGALVLVRRRRRGRAG